MTLMCFDATSLFLDWFSYRQTCANKCAFSLEYALLYAMDGIIEFVTRCYKN